MLRSQNSYYLNNWCVYPWVNSFYNAPFGIGGNIFNATSPDLLHTEAAGISKNVTIWTFNNINIVQENDKNFKDSMVILDNRFINFLPLKCNIEHMKWEYFIFGISQFVDKDKNNRNNTTGTFSGFRSSAFVSILFQLYFCISPNDDILPNIPKYNLHVIANLS